MQNQIGKPRPPAADEIKIFDNDDKATKHSFSQNVLWPCYHYQKYFISSRRPWSPNSISHLFHPGLFSYSFRSLHFSPGVFWLRFCLLIWTFWVRTTSYERLQFIFWQLHILTNVTLNSLLGLNFYTINFRPLYT